MPPVPNLSLIEAVQREADSWQRGMSSDSQFSLPQAATLPLCLGWLSCLGPAASPQTAVVAAEGALHVGGCLLSVLECSGLALGVPSPTAPLGYATGSASACCILWGTPQPIPALTHCIPGMCYRLILSLLCSLGYTTAHPRPQCTPWDRPVPFLSCSTKGTPKRPSHLILGSSHQDRRPLPPWAQEPSCTWHQLSQMSPHGHCGERGGRVWVLSRSLGWAGVMCGGNGPLGTLSPPATPFPWQWG